MARAAQHVPEMTLVNWPPSMRSVVTMPDRKWKRDNVRLGGIQERKQTNAHANSTRTRTCTRTRKHWNSHGTRRRTCIDALPLRLAHLRD